MDMAKLSELLIYNHIDGSLVWLERRQEMFKDLRSCRVWNSRYANKPAMTAMATAGYLTGRVFGKTQYAHRVAWALFNGRWPDCQIDHINGNRADNRIANLRHVTHTQNARNTSSRAGSTSCYLGVSWNKARKKWETKIKAGGKLLNLGFYENEEVAAAAYNSGAQEHFGEFARLNIIGGS